MTKAPRRIRGAAATVAATAAVYFILSGLALATAPAAATTAAAEECPPCECVCPSGLSPMRQTVRVSLHLGNTNHRVVVVLEPETTIASLKEMAASQLGKKLGSISTPELSDLLDGQDSWLDPQYTVGELGLADYKASVTRIGVEAIGSALQGGGSATAEPLPPSIEQPSCQQPADPTGGGAAAGSCAEDRPGGQVGPGAVAGPAGGGALDKQEGWAGDIESLMAELRTSLIGSAGPERPDTREGGGGGAAEEDAHLEELGAWLAGVLDDEASSSSSDQL